MTQSSAKKILVIDDDQVILKAMSAKLGGYGYRVITASDGSEAIATVRDEKPDLIVLDIDFPPDVANGGRVTWDGFQIMSWLRGMKEAEHILFVIISGGDPKDYEGRALSQGAFAFFRKPVDHKDLLLAVKRALGND